MQQKKFIWGGLLILGAVVLLIVTSTEANAEYFMTIDELKAEGAQVTGKSLRVSGAVDGDTIEYDAQSLTLSFEVAHVTGNNADIEAQGGLAKVLHEAVVDTTRERLQVVYVGAKPDLLRGEAQAIMVGSISDDGIFYADELLLKCPTKYEEAVPEPLDNFTPIT
ncbi:MAG: cytochrome c maturation protein CcmE [Anaerolineae bacterium]|nr:cytochrome c maturation protein CcmE [Anaerolineae bacterium]MDK1117947.1 cytochrome c maturation protein CcmE [Anaerolineae bacterium]